MKSPRTRCSTSISVRSRSRASPQAACLPHHDMGKLFVHCHHMVQLVVLPANPLMGSIQFLRQRVELVQRQLCRRPQAPVGFGHAHEAAGVVALGDAGHLAEDDTPSEDRRGETTGVAHQGPTGGLPGQSEVAQVLPGLV